MGSFFHDLKAVFDQGNMADACKLQVSFEMADFAGPY